MPRARSPLVATLLSATFLLSFLPAQSATISGTSCSKSGVTKTVSNIKYTCVKSGKKLIWNKGVAVKATPKPTPTPSPSEAPKANNDVVAIKVGDQCSSADKGLTKNTKSGTYICKHDGISAFRWEVAEPTSSPSPTASPSPQPTKIQKTNSYYGNAYKDLTNYLSANHDTLNINWHISEAVKSRSHQTYLDSVELGARLWYQDFNNNSLNIILFTEKDEAWIDQKQRELMGNWLVNPAEQLQSNRLKTTGCNIGGFYFPNIILACVKDQSETKDKFGAAMMFVHEFTHLSGFTSMQLTNKPIADNSRFRPAWVEEGMATFMGFFGASQLDPNFADDREQFLTTIRTSMDRKSRESVTKAFHEVEKTDYATNVQDAYFLGSISFEYLAKEYGVSKIFETNRLFYKGNSWNSAFQQVYGFSVDTLIAHIADVVVAEAWNS